MQSAKPVYGKGVQATAEDSVGTLSTASAGVMVPVVVKWIRRLAAICFLQMTVMLCGAAGVIAVKTGVWGMLWCSFYLIVAACFGIPGGFLLQHASDLKRMAHDGTREGDSQSLFGSRASQESCWKALAISAFVLTLLTLPFTLMIASLGLAKSW